MAITKEQLISQFGNEWLALPPATLQAVLNNGTAGDYYGHPYLYNVFGGTIGRMDWIMPQSLAGLINTATGDIDWWLYDDFSSAGQQPSKLQADVNMTYYDWQPLSQIDLDKGMLSGRFVLKEPYRSAWRRLQSNGWVQVRPNPFNGSYMSFGAQGGFRNPDVISWDPQLGLITPAANYLERQEDLFSKYIGTLIMAGLAAMVAPAIAAQGASTATGSGGGLSVSAGGSGLTESTGGWISAEGGAGYVGGAAADASEIAAAAIADAPSFLDVSQLNFSSPDPFEAVANTGVGVDPSVIDVSNIDFVGNAAEFNPMDPFTVIQEPMVPWDTGISVDLSSSGADLLNNKPPTPSSSSGGGSGSSGAPTDAATTVSQPANVLSPSKLLNDAGTILGTAGKVVSIIGAGTALKDAQGGKVSTGSGGGGSSGSGGGVGVGYDFFNVPPIDSGSPQTMVTTEETPINWLLIAAILGGGYLLSRKDK